MTVSELIEKLRVYPQEAEILYWGDLEITVGCGRFSIDTPVEDLPKWGTPPKRPQRESPSNYGPYGTNKNYQ